MEQEHSPPESKFKGNKEFPTPEAARLRRERRARRVEASDALHALRPQPPGPIIQSLLDGMMEDASVESVLAQAKEQGYA